MDLEKEIELIKQRNKHVEFDKKWERSPIRIILIGILTYLVILTYSYFIDVKSNIFLSSAVPVIGFFLSTVSLDFIKKIQRKGEANENT